MKLLRAGVSRCSADQGRVARIAGLVNRYDDLPPGTTDASVIAVAERLDIDEIATLDHRHFRVVRPSHAGTNSGQSRSRLRSFVCQFRATLIGNRPVRRVRVGPARLAELAL